MSDADEAEVPPRASGADVRYRYGFSAENNETVMHLDAEVDLIGPAALLPQLARRAVKGV